MFKRPIVGTYELVAFSGAVVIGFSMPLTSLVRQHIFVDFLILKFSQKVRNIFNIGTRVFGDCAILTDRLEHVQVCMGSAEIGRGFPYLTDAVLPCCLRGGGLLVYPVPGVRVRYYKNHWRRIRCMRSR